MAVQGFGKAQLGRLTSAVGQTAPSSFVTAAAGLAPIADVPGGGRGEGYGPHSDPPITPPVRPVSIRLRGSAAPASPMRHIAPWMRLPLAPVGAPPPPARRGAAGPFARILGVAASALGHCIASREAGEGAGVCMELEGRCFCNSEVRILSPQPCDTQELARLRAISQVESLSPLTDLGGFNGLRGRCLQGTILTNGFR